MFIKVRVSHKSTNITESRRQRKCKYSLTGNPGHIMEMLRDLYKRSHHIYITTHIHCRPQNICDAKEKGHMKIYPKYSFQPTTVQTWETNLAHWVCYVQHQQARGGIMRQPIGFENTSPYTKCIFLTIIMTTMMIISKTGSCIYARAPSPLGGWRGCFQVLLVWNKVKQNQPSHWK